MRETLGDRTSAYQLADGDFLDNGIAVCVQDEFTAIKDKVSSVKLPPELRVGNSKVGIRREDQLTANIIVNSARYVETTVKLLWNLENGASKEDLIEIFNVQKAHIDYLRQEHSGLVVTGQFGQKTSQLFRNLSRGTSKLDNKDLNTLLKAVQLTGTEVTNRPVGTSRQQSGYWRRFGRGYQHGYSGRRPNYRENPGGFSNAHYNGSE